MSFEFPLLCEQIVASLVSAHPSGSSSLTLRLPSTSPPYRSPGAVAPGELAEVRGRERPVLLRDRGDVRAGVVDTHRLGWAALREEDDVGLHTGAVRREGSPGQPEHRVQVAVLGEHLEHLARLVGK